MPAFTDHYRISRQQHHQLRDSSSSSLSSTAAPAAAAATTTAATATGGIAGAAGGAFASSRPRIYPREYNTRRTKSPHLSNATSPLLSALQNPSELFNRSIPFPSFLSSSSPSSGAPNSLGSASASGGVGLSGGPSPPPSAPASYSSAGGFSVPRQVRGYPGFEEQYNASHSSAGGYYNPTHRYSHGSPVPVGGGRSSGAHSHPGDGGYACEFATLDEPGFTGGSTRSAGNGGDNVVCLGWEGGVDIWRVGRGVVEQLGRLEGVKGGVKGAKLLPNPPLNDPLAALRPLVCLTIHSPIPNVASDGERPPPIMLESESPYSTSPPSRPGTSHSERSSDPSQAATEWETTVEVWSLSSKSRVARLFTSPPIPVDDTVFGIQAPPPVWGGLRVQVTGTRIVVGVGTSGELYIFGLEGISGGGKRNGSRDVAEWKCYDKVWTAIQVSPNVNGSFSSDSGLSGLDGRTPSLAGLYVGQPVFSLSDRWLAYCPASAGSFSAGGEVNVPHTSASVLSHAPPAQPPISAAVSLEDEAFFNRMAREVTQEAIRGAKWAADAGYKKLQSYWNGSQATGTSPPPPPLPAGMGGYSVQGGLANFPPTHPQPSGLGQQLRQMQQMSGSPQQAPQFYAGQQSNEPRLVSIVDLAKLASGQQANAPPMATFLPPAGVSFLSFAPGGLALLTASSKGDMVFVWDLMKVVHHPPTNSFSHQRSSSTSPSQDAKPVAGFAANTDALGKHIRQIARFTRMTVATIVDVDWSSPRGDKLAVVTERGTAHFYDLPSGALTWPALRRPPPSSTALMNPQASAAGAALSNAVNLFNSSTQPLLTAARRRRSRSSSVGSPSGGIGVFASGSHSGRRTNSTSGLGSSPNELPAGGDKIPLPPSMAGVSPGCVKFLTGKERGFVAVLGGGLLRIYELRPGGFSGKKGSKTGGVANGNWFEYDLPLLPTAPETIDASGGDGKAAGFWSVRQHHARDEDEQPRDFLSYAEIETNAAFVPWHQEKRVKVFVYTPPASPQPAFQRREEPMQEETPSLGSTPPSNALTTAAILSPNPVPWMSEPAPEDAQPPPPPATEKRERRSKKKRSSALAQSQPASRAESPAPMPESAPAPTSAPAPDSKPKDTEREKRRSSRKQAQNQKHAPAQDEKWVFGLPIETERIFLRDADGHGDVEFLDEGDEGLVRAMRDGLDLAGPTKVGTGAAGIVVVEEGFFEDDVEVLEYA